MKKIYSLTFLLFLSAYISQAQLQLWGTTSSGGGPDTAGTIFKINADGSAFSVAHVCDTAGGFAPYGSLVQAPNGYLYGMTEQGGEYTFGVIFRYDPVNYTYSKVFDFDYYSNGGYSDNSLSVIDGIIYGMTAGGGYYGKGTIFSLNPDGNVFNHLYDFSDSSGTYPFGVITKGPNGKLYGMTSEGGRNNAGVLFSFDTTDKSVTRLHHFSSATGSKPYGSLLFANDKFYGMTSEGGMYDYGTIFSFDTAGSVYTDVYDFNDTIGSQPYGSVILYDDGLLYGMTSHGGANINYGTIFNFDPASNVYADIYDFNASNGSAPEGDLLKSSNGLLYGLTSLGGSYDAGVLFSIDPANTGSSFTDLLNFNIANGQYPKAGLIEILATGIHENGNDLTFHLYPNPVANELSIQSKGKAIDKLEIYNLVGEKVYNRESSHLKANAATVDVSAFSAGIYFIHLRNGQDAWVGKFVKE